MTDTLTVELAQIAYDAAANPRGTEPGDVDELAASIKTHGLLQPVIVEANVVDGQIVDEAPWRLVAGYRRLAAARKLGLKSVPVLAIEPGRTGSVALVENLQRENLHPVAEARALDELRHELASRGKPATHKKIAAAVGKSESWVQSRLQLLVASPKVLDLMTAGTVPIVAADRLRQIAAHSPAIAEAVAEGLAAWATDEDWRDFIDDPGEMLNRMDDNGEGEHEGPFLMAVWPHGHVAHQALDLDDDLAARCEAVKRASWDALTFSDTAVDAARAYGCLLELEEQHGRTRRFVTDREWMVEWVRQNVEAIEKRIAERPGPPQVAASSNGAEPAKGTTKEARERRDAARLANTNLGAALWKEFPAVEISVDSLRAIAGLVVFALGRELGTSLALIREDWQTVKGRGSVEYGFDEARDKLVAEIMDARSPEGIVATLMQAAVAAWWADTEAVPQSKRHQVWSPYQLQRGGGGPLERHLRTWMIDVGRECAGQHMLDRHARYLEDVAADEAGEGGPGADGEARQGEGEGGTPAGPHAAAQAAQLPDGHVWCERCGGDGGDLDDSTKDCDVCDGLGHVPAPETASA